MSTSFVTDKFGVRYKRISIKGNGFCGFNSLAYCFTGSQSAFAEIIEDCINVFHEIPDLFRQHTNYGCNNGSRFTLHDYKIMMRSAIANIADGSIAQEDCWCEDGHLIAMSLLCDTAIFMYSTMVSEWYSFNASGMRGYICLLNTTGHIEVLHGVDNVPTVPRAFQVQGLSRTAYPVADHLWDRLLRAVYSFDVIWLWPDQVHSTCDGNKHVSAKSTTKTATNTCNYPGCTYKAKTKQGLLMHNKIKHAANIRQQSKTTLISVDTCDNATSNDEILSEFIMPIKRSLYSCNHTDCKYKTDNTKLFQNHIAKQHTVVIRLQRIKSGDYSQPSVESDKRSKKSAPVTCNYPGCVHIAKTQQGLMMHIRMKHAAIKSNTPVTCNYPGCAYIAKTQPGLMMHIKVKHTAIKSGQCIKSLFSVQTSNSPTGYEGLSSEFIPSDIHPGSCHTIFGESSNLSPRRKSARIAMQQNRCEMTEHPASCHTTLSEKQGLQSNGCSKSSNLSPRRTCARITVQQNRCKLMKHPGNCHTTFGEKQGLQSDDCSQSSNLSPRRKSARISMQQTRCELMEHAAIKTTKYSSVSNSPCPVVNLCSVPSSQASAVTTEMAHDYSRIGYSTKWSLKEDYKCKLRGVRKAYTSSVNATCKKHVDPLYDKLKLYHDTLQQTVSNTTTEKFSREVQDVVVDMSVIGDNRVYSWSEEDEKRLNELNVACKLLQPRPNWTWGAADDTPIGKLNDEIMQLTMTENCEWKLIECKQCESTGILVGSDQIRSQVCYDCLQLNRLRAQKKTKEEAWTKVKPVSKKFPKRVEQGHEHEDLPDLQPGDKAVIAPVHPVVTVQKNHYAGKKMKLESISLLQDPAPTWSKVLPRTSLLDRFMVIERRAKDNTKRYVVASPDRVRQWLRYLFKHHTGFVEMSASNRLAMSEEAIEVLRSNKELAEVDFGLVEHTHEEATQIERDMERDDDGLTDTAQTSAGTETHIFTFDRYPELYLRSKEIVRIRKEGKLEIVSDETVRRPTYNHSANLAFPHLYPNGEMSPLDLGDYKLSRYVLKKQSLFAHVMANGQLRWQYAADDIHMAHQYSRLCEQSVRATVGYYISAHPQVAHVPMNKIVTAFKDGIDQDSGLLDSHLPDLTTIMSQLPNSRHKWFSERLGIEAISRDIGSPNVFMTINIEPRTDPGVRALLYELSTGKKMSRDEPFEKNTAKFTELINRFAPQVSVYLYRKVHNMLKAFFTDICGIPEITEKNWASCDVTTVGWYWGRVEFTETRGFPHYHYLVKLPHVLDTGLLGRMIHNGRVVRTEIKHGNIRPDMKEEAWKIVEMGLLASRYVVLLSNSISTCSFYSEHVGVDEHREESVVKLEPLRKEFVENYQSDNISLKTHPLLRRFTDEEECDPNGFMEEAKVASVSCMHNCMQSSCGGNQSGDGCRFDFPKNLLPQTVVALMQVNANQMEARVLSRRTCDRIPNLNRYFLRYLRSNHDVTLLIDSAHKLRYATKYCSKSAKHTELLHEIIEHLNKRSMQLLPPNIKQVLTHLLLADCSHRSFISKQELAYRVMELPVITKSFPNVDIVGFYKRANLFVPYDDDNVIEFSDRTEYSAYAERCRPSTRLGKGLTVESIEDMAFFEFAQTVNHAWKVERREESSLGTTSKRKFRTRDINSGYWCLSLCQRRRHTRPSTVLHTAPAIDYEYVEHGKTTTQTAFYDLDIEKRHQLYRSYYELVMYLPWKVSPDEKFLSAEVRKRLLEDDPEVDERHSLMRLEEFCHVYKEKFKAGKVAPPGSTWQKDNQFSYSMYLVKGHNRDVHLDRVDNRGVLKAQYEDCDELVDVDVDIRPDIHDPEDSSDFPTVENFVPPDTFYDIVHQKPPELSEISVAFPLNHQWQALEELAVHDRAKRFLADPPPSTVAYEDMTPIQQWAVRVGTDESYQICYIVGVAGSGKSTCALKICEKFKGRLQAGSCTAKAASIFRGPTTHSMFGWTHNEHSSPLTEVKPDSKKIQDLRAFYEGIDVFVIDEINCMPAASLALLDETMTAIFNPKRKLNSNKQLPPFGGKKMIFLGDPAQLRPIGGAAIYDDGPLTADGTTKTVKRDSRQCKRSKSGQLLYQKYLVPNCIFLQRSQRNSGLLADICYRMRSGELTDEDCTKLTYMRSRFPDVQADYGIHYENDVCAMHNVCKLWSECSSADSQRRMYLCKAVYHDQPDNQDVSDALSVLPARAYDYAPDILCVAVGCEVRVVKNINVSAGLINSACGTVVKVIYNNADVQSLLDGNHPPPYCIIVDFPGFHGFMESSKNNATRIFPFPNRPSWVPIFRKKFSVKIQDLPSWVRKRQLEKHCYRLQFPLDLASNITAHRAQGQTLSGSLVAVDLCLENPDRKVPAEIGSIMYVACTRVNDIANLFVSSIYPSVWKTIGKTEMDNRRRAVEQKLRAASAELAWRHAVYSEMKQELAWTPDCSKSDEEWQQLQQQTIAPKSTKVHNMPITCESDYTVVVGETEFSLFTTPVMSERHIGIDQGVNNFGISVVEKSLNGRPNIVAAENYTNLDLEDGFQPSDVLLTLREHTDLLDWMKPSNDTSTVDRVVVHLEQIAIQNRHSKQMSARLGCLLQQQASDTSTCIVKMSQPHIHRSSGPVFQLGDGIVDTLQLRPIKYNASRSAADSNPSVTASQLTREEDVEPSSDDEQNTPSTTYRRKKSMSADVFRYIIEADDSQLADMKLTINSTLQSTWRQRIAESSSIKLDDVGDSLLHALDEMLCGSTNYKQLVPAMPSVSTNRTIAIAVFPSTSYWVVLHCTWNCFLLEDFGCFTSGLEGSFYKDNSTVSSIKSGLSSVSELRTALHEFCCNDGCYLPVSHIKVVVKQQTAFDGFDLSREEAGALTTSTVRAVKDICDNVMGPSSKLCDRNDKVLGCMYSRTSAVVDTKYQVVSSTGKHTNTLLSCLDWFKLNLPDFVSQRRITMDEHEKRIFFRALLDLAQSDEGRMNMMKLSMFAKIKLLSTGVKSLMKSDSYFTRNIADLVLVAMSKNQQHVKAVAANSRH